MLELKVIQTGWYGNRIEGRFFGTNGTWEWYPIIGSQKKDFEIGG